LKNTEREIREGGSVKMSIKARRGLLLVALMFVIVSALVLSVGVNSPTEAQTTGGDTITPSEVTATLNAGESMDVHKDVHLDALPAKADIVIAIDTTGSMGFAISQAKNEATQLVNDLQASIPGARFAVVDFKDYPVSPYGGSSDYPYRLLTPGLTSDASAVQSAINGLSASGGADLPESFNRVFYEAYSDAALNYDPEAEKFLVVLSDAPPHDPNLATVAPACGNWGPVDPGRDGVAGTSDDLLTQDTLQGLSDNNITMLMINYGGSFLSCYQQLAEKTGGSAVISGTDLSQTIIDLELPSIGWLLFLPDSSPNDWIASCPTVVTFATRLLTEPLSRE
jgi:Mg-chelatase subunit ChlD